MQIDSIPLFIIPEGIETRWASAENPTGERGGACRSNDGRKRSASVDPLAAGASFTMAEATGTSGTIRRIWFTLPDRRPKMLRGLRIDMYWDGAGTPAVSAPLGDFFGHGLGRMVTFESALFSSPEGRSLNCLVPMPFLNGMKIVVTNETDTDVPYFFYEVDYTLGDIHQPGTLYFHAHWRRENPTMLRRDFEVLPQIRGRGRFLGVNIGVIANTKVYFKSWWGEGEVKIYLDGDTDHATLCGTGTEDYIGTAWGQGKYANAYQGCPLADEEKGQYSFYRLHVLDPVYFRNDIRITIQQIGCWNPATMPQMHDSGLALYHGNKPVDMIAAVAAKGCGIFERRDDWSSCAYFYLNTPENNLFPLSTVQQRVEGLIE